jgi:hypothetical protein
MALHRSHAVFPRECEVKAGKSSQTRLDRAVAVPSHSRRRHKAKVGESGPTIDSIDIVEFKSNAELKEWLGKTAGGFLH